MVQQNFMVDFRPEDFFEVVRGTRGMNTTREVAAFSSLISESDRKSIVYIGAGTGRLLLSFKKAGLSFTSLVENNPRFIERLGKKRERGHVSASTKIIMCDVRAIKSPLGQMAIAPFTLLNGYSFEEQEHIIFACLNAGGGKAVLDTIAAPHVTEDIVKGQEKGERVYEFWYRAPTWYQAFAEKNGLRMRHHTYPYCTSSISGNVIFHTLYSFERV